MAPDGLPLVGPFGAEGLWLAEAVEPDYAFGAGRMLASWMSVGNALVDAAAVDPRRFAPDRARRAADAADAAESAIYAFGAWSGAHEDLDVGNPKLMNAAYGLDELIVSFAYDIPEVRNATSAIWAAVAARCAELGVMVPRQLNRGVSGVHALSAGSSLLFAQACPQRVTSSFAGRAQAVAMPQYGAPGCRGGRQRTAIVMNKHRASEYSSPADLRGARAAVLSADSLYSWSMLGAFVGGGGLAELGEIVLVDSYEEALAAVRNLEVDVAAVDCVLFELLHRYRLPAVAEVSVVGYAPLAPSMPFFTSARTPHGVVRKIRRALREVAADPAVRWALDAVMLESFAFDVGVPALEREVRSKLPPPGGPPRPARPIAPRPGRYAPEVVGRPLVIQACLAKDSEFLSGVFADLRRAVTASKGNKMPLWTATSIAVGGLRMALQVGGAVGGVPVAPIAGALTSALALSSSGRVGNEGSEARVSTALGGGERDVALAGPIDSIRWISSCAFSFVVVSMGVAGRSLEHFDPLRLAGPKCLATCTTIIDRTAVQVGVFRFSDDALRAVERIDAESGSSMRPCLIYAGDVQPPAAGGAFELDRAIKRCVVWNTHARAGIDSVF